MRLTLSLRVLSALALLCLACAVAQGQERPDDAPEVTFAYVACSDAKQVQTYVLTREGALKAGPSLTLEGKPGAMAASAEGARLYVAVSQRVGRRWVERVATLRRLKGGELELEGSVEVGARVTYLRASKRGPFVLGACYGGARALVIALDKGVGATLQQTLALEKTAHCLELDPRGRFAFVPHTKPNKVVQLRFDAKRGALKLNTPPFVAGPQGSERQDQPRHLRFHPQRALAISSNERGGGISSWAFDAKRGTLRLLETHSTLPPKQAEGRWAAAEVRITPDGRFAYVSNRDLERRQRDTLAGFTIGAKGKLTKIGDFPTVSIPRAFTTDARGRFVLAAGQGDHQIATYRINAKSGALEPLARIKVGERPSWIVCLEGAPKGER